MNYNGSNQESSEEAGKEDRKKEIVFLYTQTHIFWLEEKFSSLLFAVFLRYETLFRQKIQVKFITC